MEYHVLSNSDIKQILLDGGIYGGVILAILWAVFGYLAHRDACSNQSTKGIFSKYVPWLVLLILLSEISIFIYRIVSYPWDIEPLPSQASALRELNYLGSGYPLWGWANDYQLSLLSALSGSIMWFCWTIYAFNFKPSGTTWWKKTCKVLAYIILSATILGFNVHELRDLWIYLGIIIVVVVLLWIAKVRPSKNEILIQVKEDSIVNEESVATCDSTINEDHSRFMPKPCVEQQIQNEELSNPISEPVVIESESRKEIINPLHSVKEEIVEEAIIHSPENEARTDVYYDMEMMYCKYCGKRIEADSTFCKYCGKRL